MKIKPSFFRLFVLGAIAALAIDAVYSHTALGASPRPVQSPSPTEPGHLKDLLLRVNVDLDTEKGPGAVEAKVDLPVNWEEQGEILIGGKRVTLAPTRASGVPELTLLILDEQGGKIHESKVPFIDNVKIKAKLEPGPSGVFKVAISVTKL